MRMKQAFLASFTRLRVCNLKEYLPRNEARTTILYAYKEYLSWLALGNCQIRFQSSLDLNTFKTCLYVQGDSQLLILKIPH
jgi:hypothetical protein